MKPADHALFLWPEAARLTASDWLPGGPSSADVEAVLHKSFPDAHPVLFSSARAALTAVLQCAGISRPDHVWCPGYSSHCVLEAIAHVGTPTPHPTPATKAALVYHQWGFVHAVDFGSGAPLVIEDAVDTLLRPGAPVFASGGRFTLWSLPKVLATQGGGVAFCRSEGDAQDLRRIRSQRPASLLQACLRLRADSSPAAAAYWNGAESMQGELAAPLRKQVWRALRGFDAVAGGRASFLARWAPGLAARIASSGRLPSNLPLRVPQAWREVWSNTGPVTSGLRNFNVSRTCPQASWMQVAPLPVHLGMGDAEMTRIFARLGTGGLDEHQVV